MVYLYTVSSALSQVIKHQVVMSLTVNAFLCPPWPVISLRPFRPSDKTLLQFNF